MIQHNALAVPVPIELSTQRDVAALPAQARAVGLPPSVSIVEALLADRDRLVSLEWLSLSCPLSIAFLRALAKLEFIRGISLSAVTERDESVIEGLGGLNHLKTLAITLSGHADCIRRYVRTAPLIEALACHFAYSVSSDLLSEIAALPALHALSIEDTSDVHPQVFEFLGTAAGLTVLEIRRSPCIADELPKLVLGPSVSWLVLDNVATDAMLLEAIDDIRRVRTLSLSYSDYITGATIRAFAEAQPAVELLHLQRLTAITGADLMPLLRCHSLKRIELEEMCVDSTIAGVFTERGIECSISTRGVAKG